MANMPKRYIFNQNVSTIEKSMRSCAHYTRYIFYYSDAYMLTQIGLWPMHTGEGLHSKYILFQLEELSMLPWRCAVQKFHSAFLDCLQ